MPQDDSRRTAERMGTNVQLEIDCGPTETVGPVEGSLSRADRRCSIRVGPVTLSIACVGDPRETGEACCDMVRGGVCC